MQQNDSFTYDPLAPDFGETIYQVYDDLREHHPIYRHPRGFWLLSRYEHVTQVLKQPQIFSSNVYGWDGYLAKDATAVERLRSDWLLVSDPGKHTRLRSLVQRAFTPRSIASVRPRIERLVHDLLDEFETEATPDLLTTFAKPLPIEIICEMLGIPELERARLGEWMESLSLLADVVTSSALVRANQVSEKVITFFEELLSKRSGRENDLLQALVDAREEKDRLSEAELIANAVLFFVAGHETTVNLIGNGARILASNASARDYFLSNPDNQNLVVEELLRFESPVQMAGRVTREAVTIGGQHLKRGELLHVLIGAANRDPRQFDSPQQFDPQRSPNRHLSFGHGIHFCLGAALGRMEAQIALGELFRRFPRLQLADAEATWDRSIVFRRLSHLRVSLQG